MKKTWIVILIIVVIIALVAMANNRKDVDDEMDMKDMTPVTSVSNNDVVIPDVVTSTNSTPIFTVLGGNFYFKPNTIKVKEGDTVTINFQNDGGMHDFVIDEFNVKTKAVQTGTQQVTFVASKKGTFEYYCSVGEHRKMGMKGNLIVE